jgi:hypothetical protein
LSIHFVGRILSRLALTGLLSVFCAGQQTTTPSNATGQTQPTPAQLTPQTQSRSDKGEDKTNTSGPSNTSGTSNDRLFFTLPNFLTIENAGKIPPLTTKQKFGVVTRGSFDYVQYPWYGFLSAISQAQDSEPGYGQGWAGYGKRYGAAFADGTIENYMTGAILPSLLRQDPRYFQSGQGSFTHRAWYAASRNLITRTDSGRNQFNYSEVVGGALSAAISTYSYHPKSKVVTTTTPGVYRFIASDRTLANTAKVWGTQYGYDTMTLVIKEFWPDIRRKISHKGNAGAGRDQPDAASLSSR